MVLALKLVEVAIVTYYYPEVAEGYAKEILRNARGCAKIIDPYVDEVTLNCC